MVAGATAAIQRVAAAIRDVAPARSLSTGGGGAATCARDTSAAAVLRRRTRSTDSTCRATGCIVVDVAGGPAAAAVSAARWRTGACPVRAHQARSARRSVGDRHAPPGSLIACLTDGTGAAITGTTVDAVPAVVDDLPALAVTGLSLGYWLTTWLLRVLPGFLARAILVALVLLPVFLLLVAAITLPRALAGLLALGCVTLPGICRLLAIESRQRTEQWQSTEETRNRAPGANCSQGA